MQTPIGSVGVLQAGTVCPMGRPIVRVLIVDDYEPWRRFIRLTLLAYDKLQVLGEVSDGLEAVEKARQLQPDLILLDIGLPHLNGIEAARRIREGSPRSKILFVSENRAWEIAEEALRVGTSGYVVKSGAASELLTAIWAVLEGKQFLSPSLSGHSLSHPAEPKPSNILDSPQTVALRTRPRFALQKIFIGPHGLRAGWRVLIFFGILFAVGLCLRPLGKMGGNTNPRLAVPPGPMLVGEFLRAVAVLIATGIMARFIDRKPWGYFGMPLRNAFRSSFWIGAASGIGLLALQLEIMCSCGWFDYGTVQLHGGAIVEYGLMWAFMFLFVGIEEEATLRGYVQRVTTDGLSFLPGNWSFWASAVLFSLLFAAAHLANPGENKFGLIMVFIDGIVMCFSLWRTGNLWFAIGNHAAWDWGQTFVFGTPNSGLHGKHALMNPVFHGPTLLAGGTEGPEGSVLVLLSEALMAALIAVIYRKRKFPVLPDQIRIGEVRASQK